MTRYIPVVVVVTVVVTGGCRIELPCILVLIGLGMLLRSTVMWVRMSFVGMYRALLLFCRWVLVRRYGLCVRMLSWWIGKY